MAVEKLGYVYPNTMSDYVATVSRLSLEETIARFEETMLNQPVEVVRERLRKKVKNIKINIDGSEPQ